MTNLSSTSVILSRNLSSNQCNPLNHDTRLKLKMRTTHMTLLRICGTLTTTNKVQSMCPISHLRPSEIQQMTRHHLKRLENYWKLKRKIRKKEMPMCSIDDAKEAHLCRQINQTNRKIVEHQLSRKLHKNSSKSRFWYQRLVQNL